MQGESLGVLTSKEKRGWAGKRRQALYGRFGFEGTHSESNRHHPHHHTCMTLPESRKGESASSRNTPALFGVYLLEMEDCSNM